MYRDDILVGLIFAALGIFFVAVFGPVVIKDWHDTFVYIGQCK